jgi:ABC-type transport system substrate-binding protein
MVLQILASFLLIAGNTWGSCDKSFSSRQNKKMINISLSNITFDVDPVKAWNYQHFLVLQAISETLVKTGESGRFVSGIAKSWNISNGGKLVTFHLDQKAVFQDGSRVKANDVAISLSRHFTKNSKSVVVSYLRDVIESKNKVVPEGQILDSIKVIDENTISIELVGPYVPLLSVLSMPGFSIFKAEQNFDEKSKVIGSGAYVLTVNADKKVLNLERNEKYYQQLPSTRQFCLKLLSTLEEINKSFENKNLDLAFGVPLKDFKLNQVNKDIKVVKTNTIVTLHAYINPHGDLKNIETRKALHDFIQIFHMANHDELHTPIATFIPEGFLPRDYYERAKPLLQKMKLSKPIKLLLHENYFSTEYIRKWNDFVKKNGANIVTEALSSGNLYDALDAKKFDVITIPYMANFPDPDGFLELLGPGQVFDKDLSSSKKFLEEISKIRYIQDTQERLKKYANILTIFENEFLIVPMSKVTLPLMHMKGVSLPDTSYKYEADLRKIFWNVSK